MFLQISVNECPSAVPVACQIIAFKQPLIFGDSVGILILTLSSRSDWPVYVGVDFLASLFFLTRDLLGLFSRRHCLFWPAEILITIWLVCVWQIKLLILMRRCAHVDLLHWLNVHMLTLTLTFLGVHFKFELRARFNRRRQVLVDEYWLLLRSRRGRLQRFRAGLILRIYLLWLLQNCPLLTRNDIFFV